MKNKMILWVVIISMAALSMSCRRYIPGTEVDPKEFATQSAWTDCTNDTLVAELIQYFKILGEDNQPTVSEVLMHQKMGILRIEDRFVQWVPTSYRLYYEGTKIKERKVQRTSGPKWFTAPKVTFTLSVRNPKIFEYADVTIVTRDARIFWQVVLALGVFLLGCLGFVLSDVNNDKNGRYWGKVFFYLAFMLLLLLWYYSCILVSLIMTMYWVILVRYISKEEKRKIKEG